MPKHLWYPANVSTLTKHTASWSGRLRSSRYHPIPILFKTYTSSFFFFFHIQVLKDRFSFFKKNETNATSNYLVFPFNKYNCKVLSLSFFCWVIVDLQYYYCFRCTKIGNAPQIFVSSLHTSHANNLSILPILVRACLLGHVGLFATP